MKNLKYYENYQNVTHETSMKQDMKQANAVGKMALIDLVRTGVTQTFSLQKLQ